MGLGAAITVSFRDDANGGPSTSTATVAALGSAGRTRVSAWEGEEADLRLHSGQEGRPAPVHNQ